MKKVFLLLFFITVSFGSIGQTQARYLTFNYIPPTGPGYFNGQLHVNASMMTQPVQFFYTCTDSMGNARIGNELNILQLGAPGMIRMEIMDSACVQLIVDFFLPTDPDSLIMLDTVWTVMPSAIGATDGSIMYTMKSSLTPTYRHFTKYAGGSTYTYMTTDSVFTGLNHGYYSYKVVDSNDVANYMRYDLFLHHSTPTPCDHYTLNPQVYHASPGNCDGVIRVIPSTGLADTINYLGPINAFGTEGYPVVNDPTASFAYQDVVYNLCPQPFLLNYGQDGVSNSFYYFKRVLFLGVDTSGTYTWIPPSSVIPSGLDTMLMSASYSCVLDYSSPLDTVYIDTIISIGGNFYSFTIVIAQDTIVETVTGTIEVDTSGSFYIDFTMYCPDTLLMRSEISEYKSFRNLIYFGDFITAANELGAGRIPLQLKIYPNPSSFQIDVEFPKDFFKSLDVYTIRGEHCCAINPFIGNATIDIQSWNNGVYVLKYTDAKGETGQLKFVKL